MPGIHHGDLSKQDPGWHGHLPSSLVRRTPFARGSSPPSLIAKNRSNIGGIVVSVMMQQLNQRHPDNYLLAMRILWAPIGLMIVCWVFIPESPWFHARRGEKEKAMKAMKQIYGGVKGFNLEEEYGIIARTIEHEREVLQGAPKYIDIFRGLNLVSYPELFKLRVEDSKEGYRNAPSLSCYWPSPSRSPVSPLSAPTRHVRIRAPNQSVIANSADFFSLAGLNDPFLCTVILK
jgi:hypothetical protein